MSRVYDSLKGVVQETLQRGKPGATAGARVKGQIAAILAGELEDLERAVSERITQMKLAVAERDAAVNGEFEHAEQVMASLKENITLLENKVRDGEEIIARKESAARKTEENLISRIREIQADIKKKDEAIESCTNEITDLKTKLDGQTKQVTQLQSAIRESKTELANETKRTEHLIETHKAKVGVMEGMLRQAEDALRKKESELKTSEENLGSKIRELEDQMKFKNQLLTARDSEIKDLKSQLQTLTQGIKQMSAFFKQAEALEGHEEQNGKTQTAAPAASEPATKEPEPADGNHAASERQKGPTQTVPAQFFKRVTTELTQALGPMAAMIVQDHVAALGESIERFPSERVGELIDVVSQEIVDERQKIAFRVRVNATL
ncbi:MAG TPA: hypothetical protein VIB79_23305 [Candidatus Binatia bacterium]|jgi:chromosome segregation ATPase